MSDTAPICSRCAHGADVHWPDHERLTTACGTCLDEGIQTSRPDGSMRGTCCHRADDIRRPTDA